MTRLPIILAGALAIAGCTQADQAKATYSAANALVAADDAGRQYVMLPLCPAGKTKMPDGRLCSEAAISKQIKDKAAAAKAAYKAAEANPTSATQAAAQAALAALTALIPPVPAATTNN